MVVNIMSFPSTKAEALALLLVQAGLDKNATPESIIRDFESSLRDIEAEMEKFEYDVAKREDAINQLEG